ncbi:MAG: hypothetical protein LDL31_03320, partial [Prosthecobacter sp.]|nr:hypothetical protein [Prosthecobacter sp.]
LRPSTQDSLELLLDTLCNVFGGIILIACLLAMLSRPQHQNPLEPREVEHESGIILEKQIAQARAELDGLQKRRAEQQREEDPSLQPLVQELKTLRRTAEEKRQAIAQQDELAAQKAAQIMRDASTSQARLREQIQEAEKKLALAQKNTEAARQRHAALQQQLADLQLELESVADLQVEKLRFPKERQIDKPPAPIILRHGLIYPLYDAKGKPAPGIDHIPSPDGSFTALPQPGLGLQPVRDVQKMREFLPAYVAGGRYLTLYVYPDSFATMRALKRIIHELGLEYGMDLCDEHRVLIFSSVGAKPKPL